MKLSFFSPLGLYLWKAMESTDGWVFDKKIAHHTPSDTRWWYASGGFFFDAYNLPANLGLVERHFLYRKMCNLRSRVAAAKFDCSPIERVQEFENRLKKAQHASQSHSLKYDGVKKPKPNPDYF